MTQKLRIVQNRFMDSTIWNDFSYKKGDIVIISYIRSGTTWLQQIVGQLVFDGKENLPIAEMSPWLDLRFPPPKEKLSALEKQVHRRFIKTHLPADAIPFSNDVKYLYIARDARDVAWSSHNSFSELTDETYELFNSVNIDLPLLEKPPESRVQFFNDWMKCNGHPYWAYDENILTWWNLKDEPNVKLLHYNNLQKNMEGQIRDIASFLEIPINENNWSYVVEHCTFDYMKRNAAKSIPLEGKLWKKGVKSFMYKGTNTRWKSELSIDDIMKYESTMKKRLGESCANWMMTGYLEE
ncbi:MAG: sulfotransferase domain-containing protein [archaeon]